MVGEGLPVWEGRQTRPLHEWPPARNYNGELDDPDDDHEYNRNKKPIQPLYSQSTKSKSKAAKGEGKNGKGNDCHDNEEY